MHSSHVRSKYASLGQRISAELIDLAFLFLWLLVFVAITGAMRGTGMLPKAPESDRALWVGLGLGGRLAWTFALLLFAGPFYYSLLESSTRQATIGQTMMHIHVAGLDGEQISFGRALWRWLTKWPFAIVSLWTILSSPRRRCIHDYLAATVMVRGRRMHTRFDWFRLALSGIIPSAYGLATILAITP